MKVVGTGLSDQVVQALFDTSIVGALVKGGAGMGKTHLALLVEAKMAASCDVTWITGHRLLVTAPFAVFEPILPDLEPTVEQEAVAASMNVVQMLYEHLQDRSVVAAKVPLLIVDNAQWIDKGSCAVIEQLAASGAVKILILCRPGINDIAESTLLTDDTMLAQFLLPTLTVEEVLVSCEERLEGKIVPGAAAVLAELTGGHPLFLKVILDAAVEQRTIVQHGSVWALTSMPAEPDINASDIAMDLFNECSDTERDILEAVALAEPLSESVLHRILPGADYVGLVEANILRRSPHAASALQLAAPVFGQSLRQRIPVGRSVETRRRVLEARSSLPMSSATLMRHIGWSLDCGAQIPPRSLLHATRIANLTREYALALHLASAIDDPAYAFHARLETALAHIQLKEFVQGKQLVEVLSAECSTQAEFDAVGTLTVLTAVLEGCTTDYLEQLALHWRQAYGVLRLTSCPGADLVEALVAITSGGCPSVQLRSRLIEIGSSVNDVGIQFAATALLSHADFIEGNQAAARKNFARADRLLFYRRSWLGFFRSIFTGQHLLFLAAAGDHDLALELVNESPAGNADNGGSLKLGGSVDLAKAMREFDAGNLVAATAAYDVAIAALGETDTISVLPYALASAAYAHHLLGNHARAEQLTQGFRAIHDNAKDGFASMRLVAMAYLEASEQVDDKTEGTFAALIALADQAVAKGAVAVEITILGVLLRAGCTERLQRMSEIRVKNAGPAVAMTQAIARALLVQDASALEVVATMPGAGKNKLLAAEALGHALRIHLKNGDQPGRISVLTNLRLMRFPFQALGSPAIAELGAAAGLTVREKEIAFLVHSRHTNRDIALKFTLSQRTIEGHLYKIYMKLGVESREELYEPWLPELLSAADK